MKKLFARLRDQLRAFCTKRDGNVALIFGLALLPIMGTVGAAVDYSRANAVKAELQSALDATALMVSKSAPTLSAAALQSSAKSYFDALFRNPDAQAATIAATYKPEGSSVTVNGSTSVKTYFAAFLGLSKLDVSSSSTVSWGSSKLEVALVLDITSSMSTNDRIGKLKVAASDFLTKLRAASPVPGDVKVSIVPFGNSVNVGKTNVNQTWLNWSCYDTKGKVNFSTCTTSGGSGSSDRSQWAGCVMDRDQNHDVKNTIPATSDKKTLFPALYTTSCPPSLIPLSTDWTVLQNKIKELSAQGTEPLGGTNNTLGLVLGWQTLTPGVPFDAPAPSKNVKKIIIQMTDGQNTANRWSSNGSEVDARLIKACQNAKAADITIYMIVVEAGDSTVMRNCASDPDKYFPLGSANQMLATFTKIGTAISQPRIAK